MVQANILRDVAGCTWSAASNRKGLTICVSLSAILRTSVTPRFISADPIFSDRDHVEGQVPDMCKLQMDTM